MTHRSFDVAGLHEPSHYAHVTVASPGELVFVSGQVGAAASSERQSFRDQAVAAFANVSLALAGANCTFADVVKMNTYLVDAEDLPTLQAVRAEIFDEVFPNRSGYPTSTLVVVKALANPLFLLELDVVASRPPAAR